jgi:hypothetical protein
VTPFGADAARREQLEAQLAATEPPPPLLHPEMARIYRTKVTKLAKALQEPDTRLKATEVLRGLVDGIVLTQDPVGETLQVELRGNLAAMLGATVQTKRSPNPTTSPCKYLRLRGRDLNPRRPGTVDCSPRDVRPATASRVHRLPALSAYR